MNSTLQQLTDKIYNEGVVKAKTEADAILAQAQEQADQLLAQANEEAEKIKQNADKEAQLLRKNVESEMKLFADQSVNALKSTVTDLICDKIVTSSVEAATADQAFMQGVITKIAQSWIENGAVTISTEDEKALTDYFIANAKHLLEQGVNIQEVKGIKTSFAIQPETNAYKITVGEQEFIEYFKEFVRPKLKEMLF